MSGRLAALGLAMLLAGCSTAGPGGSGQTSAPLAGTSWLAQDIDGPGVLAGVQSTLLFDAAKRISGRAACNQYFGAVERGGGGALRLKPAGATRMACLEPVMEQERRYLEALGAVTAPHREQHALAAGRGRPRHSSAGRAEQPPGPGRYSGNALRTYIITSTLLGRPIPPNHVS
jgi:putative lipoprotein